MNINSSTGHHSSSSLSRWLPFLAWGKNISRQSLWADFLAGLTGAIVVLPQGIAYALIAGLPPEYGLYTAIITPIIAGLFGSSLHLISGPTAAISIVVMSVVSNVAVLTSGDFIAIALTLTVSVGVIQLLLGLARMGALVNFISHTVVIGFTAGAAVLIATSQMKHLLDINISAGSSFFESWILIFSQLSSLNLYSLLIGGITIISTIVIKKVAPRIPAILFGLLAGTFVSWAMNAKDLGVTMVGALSGQLPVFTLPYISQDIIGALIPGALAIAILGLVEAVSISRSIALRSGQHINGNQEFVGQGLSNFVGGFFSCYAGSGSFTRSGINYSSGAKTPLAAVFSAVTLLLVLIFAPEITRYLPFPVMAGAILIIAWNIIDIQHIRQILKTSKQERTILILTFLATLTIDLEFSIFLGVLLSLIFYLNKAANPSILEVAPRSIKAGIKLRSVDHYGLKEFSNIKIIRIDGSVFFGAASHILKTLSKIVISAEGDKHILIYGPGISYIDLAGAEMLYQEKDRLERDGYSLSFCCLKNAVKDQLKEMHYFDKLDENIFYDSVENALLALMPGIDKPALEKQMQQMINSVDKKPSSIAGA